MPVWRNLFGNYSLFIYLCVSIDDSPFTDHHHLSTTTTTRESALVAIREYQQATTKVLPHHVETAYEAVAVSGRKGASAAMMQAYARLDPSLNPIQR